MFNPHLSMGFLVPHQPLVNDTIGGAALGGMQLAEQKRANKAGESQQQQNLDFRKQALAAQFAQQSAEQAQAQQAALYHNLYTGNPAERQVAFEALGKRGLLPPAFADPEGESQAFEEGHLEATYPGGYNAAQEAQKEAKRKAAEARWRKRIADEPAPDELGITVED